MNITIKGRPYKISPMETGEHVKASLLARGFDGQIYCAIGKLGATYLAYKNAQTEEFELTTSSRITTLKSA